MKGNGFAGLSFCLSWFQFLIGSMKALKSTYFTKTGFSFNSL